jgi:Zn-dependent protease with chaperone function
MTKQMLLSFLLFICTVALSQQQDFKYNYLPLTSSGTLPNDFIVSASSKAEIEIEKIKQKGGPRNKVKDKIRFVISSGFFLDNVLKSGKVLYGDPISEYINKVLDSIINKADPQLKGEVRVYVVKSPVVNAYALDNGVILVNTGLLSQLENEAQLAFVLCHEITHYKKKHNINAHLEFVKLEKKKKSINRNGTDLLLEKSKFNKKQETEADLLGFSMYDKTNYDYTSINGLFDVLLYSYLPFDEVEFDKTFFNDNNLVVSNNYFLEKTKKIYYNENENDSLSTHPNIGKRRKEMEQKVKSKKNDGRTPFEISKTDFEHVRELARFETCRLYMLQLDYAEAIYSAYILLKKYPQNIYLKKIVAYSLYEIAAYKSLHEVYSYTYYPFTNTAYKKRQKSQVHYSLGSADSIQGSSQQVYYMLNKMSAFEISVLALHNNWLLNQKLDYKDANTREVCDSLIVILAGKHMVKLDQFSKTPRVENKTAPEPDKPNQNASKYDKIRKNKSTGESFSDDGFVKYALVDILKDPKFQSTWTNDQKYANKLKKKEKEEQQSKSPKTGKKNKKNDEEEESEIGGDVSIGDSVKLNQDEVKEVVSTLYSRGEPYKKDFKMLGIDKLVFVDPYYLKIDMRKKDNVNYFSGESKQKEYASLIEKNAGLLNLEIELLNPSTFDESDMHKYNELALVNDWLKERLQHDELDNALVLSADFKQKLNEKFDTKYFAWSGIINVRQKKAVGTHIALSFLPYLWPYTIPYLVSPDYDTYFYTIVFNIETGKIELYTEYELDMKDDNAVLNTFIYSTLYQIKSQPKQ